MHDVVQNVAKKCFLPFTVGGGIKSIADFDNLLNCGADKISINSSAISNPSLISEAANKFGSQCVVVAIDAKKLAIITMKYSAMAAPKLLKLMLLNGHRKFKN